MKTNFLKVIYLLILLFSISNTGFSQSTEATNSGSNILLKEGFTFELKELKDSYTLDASSLEFPDEITATRFFGSIRSNVIEFKFDFASKQLTVFLKAKERGLNWTIEQWNTYLLDNSVRYSSYYSRMVKI